MIDFNLYKDYVIKLRREFHEIPELGFKEFKTGKKIREYLTSYGIDDIKEYAGTGLVATIKGKGDKTIGIRSDIDALPICEETGLPFSSKHEGCMHACGHDGHIAMALTCARILNENKELIKGNVKIIFQPNEECTKGASLMIKEGVLTDLPKITYMVSGHLWPDIETGKIDLTKGTTFAYNDALYINVFGKGGHGGNPKNVKDSLYTGSKIIVKVKELSKQYGNVALSLCSMDALSNYNIYRDNVYIKGTLRSINKDIRNEILNKLNTIVNDIAKEDNIRCEFRIEYGCPSVINNTELTDIANEVLCDIIGKENVISIGPVLISEDFAEFSHKIPSVHFKIGSHTKSSPFGLHNSKYIMNEDALILGVKAFTNTALKLLSI